MKERKKLQNHKRQKFEQYTYKPKISKRSQLLTKDLHTKLNENKIPHYELLLYKGKELEKKREKIQREKEEKEAEYQQNLIRRSKSPRTYHLQSPQNKLLTQGVITQSSQKHAVDSPVSSEEKESMFLLDEELFDDSEDTFTSRLNNYEPKEETPQKVVTQKYPILFVDINLGKNRVERITINEGKSSLWSLN